MNRTSQLILSCEHGGNVVPEEFRAAFDSPLARQHLNSHRGWDPGALEAATYLADQLAAPLFQATTTRLLVDLNRSLGHEQLLSRFTGSIDPEARTAIIDKHYHPYRNRILRAFQTAVNAGSRIIHVSVHTFTPVFRGVRRKLDVGLLFDPDRALEQSLCSTWQRILRHHHPRLRIELNQPYLGIDDGLTTAMRMLFADHDYAGIELEINHRIMRRSERGRQALWRSLGDALDETLRGCSLT